MGTSLRGVLNARGQEKVAISDQYLTIARKWLKIDGYMLRCIWQALNSLFIHVTFTAIVPGALGWLKILTHILLAIAILLVGVSFIWVSWVLQVWFVSIVAWNWKEKTRSRHDQLCLKCDFKLSLTHSQYVTTYCEWASESVCGHLWLRWCVCVCDEQFCAAAASESRRLPWSRRWHAQRFGLPVLSWVFCTYYNTMQY